MTDLNKLDSAIKELEVQSKELKEFNKVYSEIGMLKKDISDTLRFLKEHNDGFSNISSEIQARLKNSTKQLENLENLLLKKIQELYQDNKNFQKDLDASLVTRLDKHKSDIQIEVRNEGIQIQRAFENTLTSNFMTMESKIIESISLQTKQLNTVKISLFLIICIGIGLAIGSYLK